VDEGQGYARELKKWVDSHAYEFEEHVDVRNIEDCEHKLSYNSMHEDYLTIFESQISAFVNRENYTIEDFFQECRAALDDSLCALFEEHAEKPYVEALMCAIDYKDWFKMMVEAAAAERSCLRESKD
jgi:hypothetical protein